MTLYALLMKLFYIVCVNMNKLIRRPKKKKSYDRQNTKHKSLSLNIKILKWIDRTPRKETYLDEGYIFKNIKKNSRF